MILKQVIQVALVASKISSDERLRVVVLGTIEDLDFIED